MIAFRISTFITSATMIMACAAVGAAPLHFKADSPYEASHPYSKYSYIEWADELNDFSNGSLVADPIIGSVLLEPTAVLKGTQSNVVQLSSMPAIYTPAAMPVSMALQELAFVLTDPVATLYAITEFSVTNSIPLAEWRKLGIVYLGGYSTPSYVLMCNTPVRNLAELAGKRIRSPGGPVSSWLESVKALPINVPSNEMYIGLDRGVLDCASNAINDLQDRSLWEVAKHTTTVSLGLYLAGPQWGANKSFWEKLTLAQRSSIFEAIASAMAKLSAYYLNPSPEFDNFIAEHNLNIYKPEQDLIDSLDHYRQIISSEIVPVAVEKYHLDRSAAKQMYPAFLEIYNKWEKLIANSDVTNLIEMKDLAMREIYNRIDLENYGVNQ